MDENHQDKTGSKLIATDNKLWTPPLSTKDQKKLDRLRKKSFAQRMGFAGKTPWDFIQLLLIPLMLAGVGYWFTSTQTQISLQNNQRQHDTDLQIAADQQQETTLKTYLDDMSDLLLNHNLYNSKPGDEVRQVARERTLTTLRRLKADRNKIVLQFLWDAGLRWIIDLSGADLSGADLSGGNLVDADLCTTNLSGAKLVGAVLEGANLEVANLREADLSDADLLSADLSYADLRGAVLLGTKISTVGLSVAELSHAEIRGADLRGANLQGTNLHGISLGNIDLDGADLSGAILYGVDLRGADLSGANLRGAKVTLKQLSEVKSLRGATMPDGSKRPW